MRLAVLKAEAHTQDLLLTRREGGEDILELLTQKCVGCLLGRLRSVIILNEVAEMTVLFFADRRLKETGSCAIFMISSTLGTSMCSSLATSSVVGSRPSV